MSVRKRKWITSNGEEKEAWVVDYIDLQGERHVETFARKKDADARHAEVRVDVKAGVHVALSKSVTVTEAGASWIRAAEAHGLERSTGRKYREHVDQHIVPFIGRDQTVGDERPDGAQVRRPAARAEAITGDGPQDYRESGIASWPMLRNRGLLHEMPCEIFAATGGGERVTCREASKGQAQGRGRHLHPDEIKAIIANAKGRWRPLLITAVFTGLRASELRGLRWRDVDLKANELHVRQRADRFNEIGKPRSTAGQRVVPFGKVVANTLREWKLACPKSDGDFVFPNGAGNIERLANIINRGLIPTRGGA